MRAAVWLASGIALVSLLLLLLVERPGRRVSRERGGASGKETHAGGEPEVGAGTTTAVSGAGKSPASRPLVRIHGRVVLADDGEQPVPGARVWAYESPELPGEAMRMDWPTEPVDATGSGPDGTFALRLPGGGRHVLYAEAPGYVVGRAFCESGREDQDLTEIWLERGVRRRFRVVDRQDRPVREAVGLLIENFGDQGGWPRAVYRGGGHGILAVNAPRRRYDLLVRAPGFATARVDLPGRSEEVTVVLGVGWTIQGVVVDEEGDPLAGQPVILDRSFRPKELAVADARGRFGFEHVDEHSGTVEVGRKGFLPYRGYPDAGDDRFRVVLKRPRSLSGVVVFPDGGPASRARVNKTVADESGRFTVQGLQPGTNTLAVRHRSLPRLPGEKTGPPAWVAYPKVEAPGPEVRVVLKRMVRSFARLRFFDRQGRPVHKVGIHSATVRKLSDEQGRLVAAFSVAAGARHPVVGIRNGLRFPFEATTYPGPDAPEQTVTIPEPPRATIVVRLAGGSPLPESLSASIQTSQWLKVIAGSRRHDRVSFHYDPLALWSFSATVGAPGHVRSRRSLGVPKPGEEIEWRLERGAVVTGVVVSAAGAPVSGIEVNLRTRGRPNQTLLTAADGSFVSPLLSPGEVEVSVVRDELRLIHLVRRLKDEARLDLGEIRIGSPRLLEGRVIGPDKQPLSGVRVDTQGDFDGITTTTRANGNFRMHASPEDQVLLVTKPGYGTVGVPVGEHGTIRMQRGGMIRLTQRRADPSDPRVTAWSTQVRYPGAKWSWQPPFDRIERKPGIWIRLYRDLPPGPLEVFVETTLGERAVPVTIVAGTTVEAELTVP